MLYTLNDRILPAYHRNSYFGAYKPIYASIHYKLNPNVIEALHFHDFAEIGFCLRGSGVTHVENRIYSFAEGDLQFIPPGMPHLSSAEPGVETSWQWISFDVVAILKEGGISQWEALTALCEQGFSGLFHPWEHPLLAELLQRFRDIAVTQDSYSAMESAFVAGQIILECMRIGKEGTPEDEERGVGGKVKSAVLYIRRHFDDKEAMREARIAEICRMSVSHFRAQFKQETGMSVREYIIQTRLAKAAYQLRNTTAGIASIAVESGFGQVSCFNRIFRKTFGLTPGQFRKQYGETGLPADYKSEPKQIQK